jgi:hypothetical protein
MLSGYRSEYGTLIGRIVFYKQTIRFWKRLIKMTGFHDAWLAPNVIPPMAEARKEHAPRAETKSPGSAVKPACTERLQSRPGRTNCFLNAVRTSG